MPASKAWVTEATDIFVKWLDPHRSLNLVKELQRIPTRNASLVKTLDDIRDELNARIAADR